MKGLILVMYETLIKTSKVQKKNQNTTQNNFEMKSHFMWID